MPKINAAGLAILKKYEGCVLSAYPDPGTGGEPFTIGWGHTGSLAAIGINRDVIMGDAITQAQADTLLQHDLDATYEPGVNGLCVRSINPNQFSALVSFAYNEGVGALSTSTLMLLVNAGHFVEAANQFQYWVWADGQVLPGLVARRQAEKQLFLTPTGG
jgi:lysozyme